MQANTFSGNQALEGGALHYNMIRPNGMFSNAFEGNTAAYGDNFSSFAAYIKTPQQNMFEGLASGQRLIPSLEFHLLDFDNQVIRNDNTSYY